MKRFPKLTLTFMKEKPVIIKAGPRWITWQQLVAYREVFRMLIFRDLKARYAQTWLGAGWVVFQPLLTVGIFATVFGRWIHLETEGVPYTLFAFSGLAAWTFVSQAIQRASQSLTLDVRFITKVYFPRLLIPTSCIIATLTDFGILTVVLTILVKLFGFPLTWHLLAFPLCLVPLCFFALGIGSLMAAMGAYYRDFTALIPLFLQTWMYGSPIVYSASIVPEKWLWLYQWNPMVGALDIIRWTFLGLPTFPLHSLLITYLVSALILVLGIVVFTRLERRFADVI